MADNSWKGIVYGQPDAVLKTPSELKTAFFRSASYITLKKGMVCTENNNKANIPKRFFQITASEYSAIRDLETETEVEDETQPSEEPVVNPDMFKDAELDLPQKTTTDSLKYRKKCIHERDFSRFIYEADDESSGENPQDSTADDQSKDTEPIEDLSLCFCVVLPGEGFTRWVLHVNSKEALKKLQNILPESQNAIAQFFKSHLFKFDFVKLWNTLNKGETKALELLRAESYVIKDGTPHFLGNCNYGLSADEDLVALTLVPYLKGKVDPQHYITFEYRLIGKYNFQGITVFGKNVTNKGSDANDVGNSSLEDGAENTNEFESLDDALQKMFKCSGNNRFYDEFLKIRKFLLNKGQFELVDKPDDNLKGSKFTY